MIIDGVMAGMARSGSVYDIEIDDDILQQAVKNTAEELKSKIKVKE
jgi:Arc/MetJ family transcription regulator